LARRNPEKLAHEKREIEVMTDEEIDAYLALSPSKPGYFTGG
jgi:hypothetical protein